MNKETRQSRIIQLLEKSEQDRVLGTRELAEDLGVSEITVRRDLQELSQEGLLQRRHGGAGRVRRREPTAAKEVGFVLVSRSNKYGDPFFNAVLEGADKRLQELGYRIAYINTHAEIMSAARASTVFQSTTTSGVILAGTAVGSEAIEYLKQHIQALVVTGGTIGPGYDEINFDGYNGMRQMVDYLVGRGYRRLGFVTGFPDARQQGFLDGVSKHGLPTDPALCISLPDDYLDGWTPELGYKGAQQLMQVAEPPDAIVCASDRLAIGVIQWLHQHGSRVPEDIAVTGFDNIAESAFTVPPLTTIHVHKQLIGKLAAERVVRRIENEDEVPLFIQTPTQLVIRNSCGSKS